MKQKLTTFIYDQLTSLRDIRWMPDLCIEIIDWFRYEVFWPKERNI
jgi:hypothetical protein